MVRPVLEIRASRGVGAAIDARKFYPDLDSRGDAGRDLESSARYETIGAPNSQYRESCLRSFQCRWGPGQRTRQTFGHAPGRVEEEPTSGNATEHGRFY